MVKVANMLKVIPKARPICVYLTIIVIVGKETYIKVENVKAIKVSNIKILLKQLLNASSVQEDILLTTISKVKFSKEEQIKIKPRIPNLSVKVPIIKFVIIV